MFSTFGEQAVLNVYIFFTSPVKLLMFLRLEREKVNINMNCVKLKTKSENRNKELMRVLKKQMSVEPITDSML